MQHLASLSDRSPFLNRTALAPHFIPDRLVERDREADMIIRHLRPLLDGDPARPFIIVGPRGSGKTTLALHLRNTQLPEAAQKVGRKLHLWMTNCRKFNTSGRALHGLLADMGVSTPTRGWTLPEYLDSLVKATNQHGGVNVLVLDEADHLADTEILYHLSRMENFSGLARNASWSVGILTTNVRFRQRLDASTLSSLRPVGFAFAPYNATQLQAIIRSRTPLAFKPGTCPDEVVNDAAAIAAQMNGDARYALELLQAAGELAEEQQLDRIGPVHLASARMVIDDRETGRMVSGLPAHQKALLLAIKHLAQGAEVPTTGITYQTYAECARKGGLTPLSYSRIQDLIVMLEKDGLVQTNVVVVGGHGRTTQIHPCIINESSFLKWIRTDPNNEADVIVAEILKWLDSRRPVA